MKKDLLRNALLPMVNIFHFFRQGRNFYHFNLDRTRIFQLRGAGPLNMGCQRKKQVAVHTETPDLEDL